METTCGTCGKPLASFETIHVAGEGPRCYRCFNRETAEHLGIDFDERRFQPIVVEDADGTPHTFTIRSMLVPTGLEMEVLERVGDGLHANMRHEMAIRHVRRTEFGWQLTSDQRLTGRIEWDPNSGIRLPLLVIDGKALTWQEVGHMLMTFEGFTLEARIKDTIDVVSDSE